MELRHLRVFLTLSEELHFGRTAARLHVAQSAVSQTLHDLEAEVEARLVERTSRQAKLTEAGQVFLVYAREAIQVVERGVKAARAADSRGGRLNIRLLTAATGTRMPSLLKRFQAENPLTVLEIQDGTSARNLEALEGAACDLALVSLASSKRLGPDYARTTIAAGALCVVMPSRHPLAMQNVIKFEDLRGQRILNLRRDDEPDVRLRLDSRLASIGAVQTAIELSHPHALFPLIAKGLGVALVPSFVAPEPLPKLCVKPIAGGRQGGMVAAWNKQRASEATRRFVALLTADENS